MASSMSSDGNEVNSENSDDQSAICGYKDVNQFSQVTFFRSDLLASNVMYELIVATSQ